MTEKLFTSSFQLWETQDATLTDVVIEKTKELGNRQKISRSYIIREALDEYFKNHYPHLLNK